MIHPIGMPEFVAKGEDAPAKSKPVERTAINGVEVFVDHHIPV
jgi:hypothetical protein